PHSCNRCQTKSLTFMPMAYSKSRTRTKVLDERTVLGFVGLMRHLLHRSTLGRCNKPACMVQALRSGKWRSKLFWTPVPRSENRRRGQPRRMRSIGSTLKSPRSTDMTLGREVSDPG